MPTVATIFLHSEISPIETEVFYFQAKPKGKVGTKGQKQIAEENKSTIQFYAMIMATATGIYFTIRIFWLLESCTWWTWVGRFSETAGQNNYHKVQYLKAGKKVLNMLVWLRS